MRKGAQGRPVGYWQAGHSCANYLCKIDLVYDGADSIALNWFNEVLYKLQYYSINLKFVGNKESELRFIFDTKWLIRPRIKANHDGTNHKQCDTNFEPNLNTLLTSVVNKPSPTLNMHRISFSFSQNMA